MSLRFDYAPSRANDPNSCPMLLLPLGDFCPKVFKRPRSPLMISPLTLKICLLVLVGILLSGYLMDMNSEAATATTSSREP